MKRATDPLIVLQDFWPDRACYRQGEHAVLHIALRHSGTEPCTVHLDVRLHWLDQLLHSVGQTLSVPAGDTTTTVSLPLPGEVFRGYGVDLAVRDEQGSLLAKGSTALDVLHDWRQAPRYGFLSDFTPGDPFAATTVATLARYHVNVVQFYDWMWRHYALMPPHEEFTDALGRALSLRTVRAKVEACRAHQMAALGYAAVYGAEPEYALAHPDQLLYDAAGEPYSLEKLFYIMNIHRGNPWRKLIIDSMADAVRAVPFDGLHLDQYGFPQGEVYGPAPAHTAYDLAKDFPPFIDDARQAVRAARPDTGVIFNAVGNWPIETVAPTTQDATYIEVWTPFDGYSDLQTLILEARHLAPQKQVILAAYLKPLLGALDADVPPAEAATRLASAAIWANGGFHLLLGERNGALCDPYYPKYATMLPDFVQVMRRYYDFVVRYENLLSDLRAVTLAGSEGLAAVRVSGAPASPFGEAGKIWSIARRLPGYSTVSLINLTGATDTDWNAPKAPATVLYNLQIEFAVADRVAAVFVASPDGTDLAALPLPYAVHQRDGATWVQVQLPRLEYWSLLVAAHASV